MMDLVLRRHRSLFRSLLEEHGLEYALVLNAADGVLGAWFLGEHAYPAGPLGVSGIPVQRPFNRNTAYIVPRDGAVQCYSQTPPHPTDPHQYPIMPCRDLEAVFDHGPVGLIHGGALKKSLRDELLRCFPQASFIELTEALERLKAQKCPKEVAGMRTAAALYQRVFSSIPLSLREGRTERELAVDIRFRLYQLGAAAEDMEQLVRVNIRSAPEGAVSIPSPLKYPGRVLRWGDRVNLLVSGFSPGGYTSALGRCYTLGKASEETRRSWDLAVQAQELAASKLRAGVTLKSVLPKLVEQIWLSHGLKPDQTNWICGMGVDRNEAPRLRDSTAEMPLQAGMTVAIGPRIAPAGKDAYCCLDVYEITENGCERLDNFTQELIELE